MSNSFKRLFFSAAFIVTSLGCAKRPAPLTYLAYELPQGPIVTTERQFEHEYPRGGFYFWNSGFRPAADVGTYLKETQEATQSTVLRDADIELRIPLAFDLFFMGYNYSNDQVWVGKPPQ